MLNEDFITLKVMTVGERIRAAPKSAGLTQDSLGLAAGVTGSAVAQWEANKTTITGPNLVAVAAAVGKSCEWVISGAASDASLEPAELHGPEGTNLTDDQSTLLSIFEALEDHNKALLMAEASRLLDVDLDERNEEIEKRRTLKEQAYARTATASEDAPG